MFHYRIDFLNQLRKKLAAEGIELVVYYGKPTRQSLERKDSQLLEWGKEIPTRTLTVAGKEILLQIPPRAIFKSDLIICMQENRLLINYVLQLATLFNKKCRFAFFGHGKNFQSTSSKGIRERFKQLIVKRSDWFFAYTDLSKKVLIQSGYPEERITVVNNTIDTRLFADAISTKSDFEKSQYRDQLKIPEDAVVGLFCGSIYALKMPQFVLDSCLVIKLRVPGFHLIVLGDGPDAYLFDDASKAQPWIHFRGMQKGDEKSLAYSVASAVINPGLVGLHIVDSFSAGVPMVTTHMPYHSPEYEYLQNGVNGVVTQSSVEAYASAVVELFLSQDKTDQISTNALASAKTYSLENMVDGFAHGIQKAIA